MNITVIPCKKCYVHVAVKGNEERRDFPGDLVVKNLHCQSRGVQVRSLVREQDPTCLMAKKLEK